ncbi:MAG: radical SAM family heme chaperone HemW [Oscillospiraceae bacterium]|nr:radical SAM family heme chaperone HemW [Oscillospiraceae bacterium]MCC8156723.1 radical SAM family heme chaperone HemW [Oscillospiraceae bacterium]MCD8128106.1 radical SAM family heme chaperone HemW [Oscillospiraceae bacterium]
MNKRLGIYIHIPFCASKCGYCDFYSLAGCDKLMPAYHNALLQHIRESAEQLRQHHTDSVYFGGGTPSYYGARRICELFNALKRAGLVYRSAEVTVEVNPDSVRAYDLALLRAEGVNRLSIGAQSANDDILKLIGRRHNWRQVVRTVKSARDAGFENLSLDLIYGLPSQTKEDWADTLNRAIDLAPEHLSCYGLKIEDGTPFETYRNSQILPDDDEQADMYLYTVETLERFGYRQYEISNFARPGHASRHNLKYWLLQDYMGFGPGAASCVGGVRYSYVRDLQEYISGVRSGGTLLAEYEPIGLLDRAAEYIMLGMRTVRGISGQEYHNIYRSDFAPLEELLQEFRHKGWTAQEENGRWHFTPAGFLLSNLLIGMMLDRQGEYKLSGNPWVDSMDAFAEREELPAGEEIFYHQPAT